MDQRFLTCVHEAGHAVVHALGGNFVYRVAVAPPGDNGAWRTHSRTGYEISDCSGICEVSESPADLLLLTWDAGKATYVANRDLMRDHLARMEKIAPGSGRNFRRQLLAHMCGLLAGPAAEQLAEGLAEPYLDESSGDLDPGDDVNKAWGHAWLRPCGRAFEHAAALTVQTLREPAVWAFVHRLAEALQTAGSLEGEALDELLPPPRQSWPPLRGVKARSAAALEGA